MGNSQTYSGPPSSSDILLARVMASQGQRKRNSFRKLLKHRIWAHKGHSSLLDSLARVLAAKSLQMSRNVYKCIRMSRQFQFFGTLFCVLPNRSSPSLKDTGRTIWGHFAAFQLTAFTCKFSLGESSGFSVRAPRMSTKRARLVGPQGEPIRFRPPYWALNRFDATILG